MVCCLEGCRKTDNENYSWGIMYKLEAAIWGEQGHDPDYNLKAAVSQHESAPMEQVHRDCLMPLGCVIHFVYRS